MRWSKPSASRSCEHSAKAIGSSEAPRERQLAWPPEDVSRLQDAEVGYLSPTAVTDI
jgi:hypothetical protein